MFFSRFLTNNIIPILSVYIFIFYFFIRILYIYYGIESVINIWYYRIFFYLPIVLWFVLILKDYFMLFSNLKKNKFLNTFLFLYLIIFMYIIFHHFFGLEYITMLVTKFQVKMLFYAILNILLGAYLYKSLTELYFQKVIFIVWLIYTLILIFNINYFTTLEYKASALRLLLSDPYVLISIIAIFINIKNKYLKIILFTLVLFLAYVLKSRATFYSLLVVYIFFIIKELGFKNFFVLCLFALVSLVVLNNLNLITLDTRMFGVLQGKSDGSLNERLLQFEYGLEAIKNNLIFGQYAGQIIIHESGYRSGEMGAYMHNFLSYWRQFGIVFFILFVYLYLNATLRLLKEWIYNSNKINQTLFYLVLFFGIESLLFRSYSNTYVWFVLGIVYMYFNTSKKEFSENSNINSLK